MRPEKPEGQRDNAGVQEASAHSGQDGGRALSPEPAQAAAAPWLQPGGGSERRSDRFLPQPRLPSGNADAGEAACFSGLVSGRRDTAPSPSLSLYPP